MSASGLVSHRKKATAFIVEETGNPSTEFFVLPKVATAFRQFFICRGSNLPEVSELVGAVVVFVRYVPAEWVRLIETAGPRLAGLVFFMDDDLFDLGAAHGMPWRYRFKLARLATRRQGWLRRQRAELWVSTPYLQHKYASWHPQLVLPSPAAEFLEVRRVFYHGSASHGAEIRWLRPVMEAALARDERLVFEVIGGRDVQRLYRGLPRVHVVHPMKWPAYKAFLAAPGRHVGLAPQLDLPFNRARSYTKLFDITQAGGVGVFSPSSACADVVEHGRDGWIVELEEAAWVDAITRLASDDALRASLLQGAQLKVEQLKAQAQAVIPGQ